MSEPRCYADIGITHEDRIGCHEVTEFSIIASTALGYRVGRAEGFSSRARWYGAGIGFALIFVPMFWDWLPTVWLHSYYCEKYAGLTVTQTPDDWRRENPGVAETLVRQTPPLQIGSKDKYYFQLNQRFRWEIEHIERPLWLQEDTYRIVDAQTGKELVRFVNFSTGQHGPSPDSLRDYKLWMKRASCALPDGNMSGDRFSKLRIEYSAIGDKK